MSCQQKKRIFFVLKTPPVRNRTFFTTQFKPYRFLRHLKCWFCDRGLRNEQFQVFWLKSLDVYFLCCELPYLFFLFELRRRSESLATGQSGFSSTGVVKTGVPDFLYFSFRESPERARRFFSRPRFDSKSVPRRSQTPQNVYFYV